MSVSPQGRPPVVLVYPVIHNRGDVIDVNRMEKSQGVTLQQDS